MPSLEPLYRDLKDQGLVILAVNIGESRGKVEDWVKRKGVTFPVLLDEETVVTSAYRVRATPTVYVIDRSGRLVARAHGTSGWTTDAGRRLLAALLASS